MSGKELDKHLGSNAKLLRELSELSQTNLANYLGISRSTYKQYENSKRKFPAYLIPTLCKLYGLKDHFDFFSEDILGTNPNLQEKLKGLKNNIQNKNKNYDFNSINCKENYLQILANDVYTNIKKKIKLYRIKNKKSQQQVAEKLGVNLSTYSRYESGEFKIDNNKLGLLSEWYQVNINEFFKK